VKRRPLDEVNKMANDIGNILVSWPHESDPLWNQDIDTQIKSIISILKSHGFKHDALISSSFLLWQGSKQKAEALAQVLQNSYPLFKVEFQLK
jgi:hypothetical protein